MAEKEPHKFLRLPGRGAVIFNGILSVVTLGIDIFATIKFLQDTRFRDAAIQVFAIISPGICFCFMIRTIAPHVGWSSSKINGESLIILLRANRVRDAFRALKDPNAVHSDFFWQLMLPLESALQAACTALPSLMANFSAIIMWKVLGLESTAPFIANALIKLLVTPTKTMPYHKARGPPTYNDRHRIWNLDGSDAWFHVACLRLVDWTAGSYRLVMFTMLYVCTSLAHVVAVLAIYALVRTCMGWTLEVYVDNGNVCQALQYFLLISPAGALCDIYWSNPSAVFVEYIRFAYPLRMAEAFVCIWMILENFSFDLDVDVWVVTGFAIYGAVNFVIWAALYPWYTQIYCGKRLAEVYQYTQQRMVILKGFQTEVTV